jgi:hypothetical protein
LPAMFLIIHLPGAAPPARTRGGGPSAYRPGAGGAGTLRSLLLAQRDERTMQQGVRLWTRRLWW